MFDRLINHIVEQRKKQQYINALATMTELQTLLLKEFSDLQKGSRPTLYAPDFANAPRISRLCPSCHQFHEEVGCPNPQSG